MSNSNKKNLFANKQGFSLIELLIVIAIIVVISGLGLFVGLDFYKTYALNSERDIVTSVLMKARNRAANNLNESPHGLYIDSNGYTIFQGISYALRDQSHDEPIKRNNAVNVSGLQEVVFEQLSGNLTTTEGEITLSNGARSIIISLNNEGRINW